MLRGLHCLLGSSVQVVHYTGGQSKQMKIKKKGYHQDWISFEPIIEACRVCPVDCLRQRYHAASELP